MRLRRSAVRAERTVMRARTGRSELRLDAQIGYARASYASGGVCVTGAADRRRRDRRLCPCQLRAGELCAVRGTAPLLICSGAASRRGLPYGGSTRFHGGSTRWQGHLGRLTGACGCGRGLPSSSGRLSPCLPDDEASCCGCRRPALPAARSRLTALVVSAGQMPGPVGQAGAGAPFRLRNAGLAGPCRVSLEW